MREKRKKGEVLNLIGALKIKLEAADATSSHSFEKEYRKLHRIALDEKDGAVYEELKAGYLSNGREDSRKYVQPWQKSFAACGALIQICSQGKTGQIDFEIRKNQIAKQIARMLDENFALFQNVLVPDEYDEDDRYLVLKVYVDILHAFLDEMREKCICMAILWQSLRLIDCNPELKGFYGEKSRKQVLERIEKNFKESGIDKTAVQSALREEEKEYIQEFGKELSKRREIEVISIRETEEKQREKEGKLQKIAVIGMVLAAAAAFGIWMILM